MPYQSLEPFPPGPLFLVLDHSRIFLDIFRKTSVSFKLVRVALIFLHLTMTMIIYYYFLYYKYYKLKLTHEKNIWCYNDPQIRVILSASYSLYIFLNKWLLSLTDLACSLVSERMDYLPFFDTAP